MINIFLDAETTGINPYCSEVIEACFKSYENGVFVDEHYFKSQVNNWSYEAELIHKINYHKMLTYQPKKKAWNSLINWLPSEFDITIYVNPNTQLGNVLFDKALIENEIMLHLDEYHTANIPFKPKNTFNVYDKAKKAFKLGLFTPNKKENRFSFTQENVYYGLFDKKYNAHNCVDDVDALIRINDELDKLLNQGSNPNLLI